MDKFTQMPWNGKTQMLFGQVDGRCERHGFRSPEIEDSDSHPTRGATPAARSAKQAPLRPPDLIIQDELHLISGPLGTLVGLYETAVDRLSSWEVDGKRVRPKVVASTATIRRAPDQVHSLFLRDVEIFPPQGTDVRDNIFSRQRDPGEEHPGRRYLGICAPGKRLKAALIRVYVAHLSRPVTPATPFESAHNIEQVVVRNPPSGTYDVEVIAELFPANNFNQLRVQPFALVFVGRGGEVRFGGLPAAGRIPVY